MYSDLSSATVQTTSVALGKNDGSPRSRSYQARAATRSRTRIPANSATVIAAPYGHRRARSRLVRALRDTPRTMSGSGSTGAERVGTLLSVNVGMPKDVAWQGKTVFTGIYKDPVTGPRRVRRL